MWPELLADMAGSAVAVCFALWLSLSAVRLLRRSFADFPTASEAPRMRCEPLEPCGVARITYPSLRGLEVRHLS